MDSLGFVDTSTSSYDALGGLVGRLGGAGGGGAARGGGAAGAFFGAEGSTAYDMRRRDGRPLWSDSSAASSSQMSESDASSAIADDTATYNGDDDEDDSGVQRAINRDKGGLPEYACAYCDYHDPLSCAMCTTCNRWFCNGRDRTSGSHIINHLVVSKHTSIALHKDGPLGDAPLECYVCGAKNIFALGFVPSKQESVVVIICREPCLHSQTLRDMEWDPSAWLPLVEEKRLLSWLCTVPSNKDRQDQHVYPIANSEARELEQLWKVNPASTVVDYLRGARASDAAGGSAVEALPLIPYHFRDGNHYREVFGQFIMRECETSREITEGLVFTGLSIVWTMGLQRRRIAVLSLPPEAGRISIGDEVLLYVGNPRESQHGGSHQHSSTSRHQGAGSATNTAHNWERYGVIVRIESSPSTNTSNELHIELSDLRREDDHEDDSFVVSHTTNVNLKFVFKPITFDRQRVAMKLMATDEQSVSAYLYHAFMGHPEGTAGGKGSRLSGIELPDDINAPKIATLNSSQAAAVRAVLTRPLSLIQGPPGTGKTSTSATLVYHMCTLNNAQVLVTSPSNVAVDQLAERVEQTGLTVVRLYARSRETISTTVDHLALHQQVRQVAANSPKYSELNKLFRLKAETGDLSDKDRKRLLALISEVERDLLMNADVICCTCSGAGDKRLQTFSFRHVLIDEATQATEPEALIPVVMGAKQVILVGDHCQMGPVIMCKPAEEAGYGRSLFERLLQLGHRPFRLEVQYRMHPALSEFSSNAFYEGTLQNGVTAADRDASALFPWPNPHKPMFFYNSIHPEEVSSSGTSFLNRTEAALAEKMATLLLRNGVLPDQVGVITPYEGQRNYLCQYLSRQGPLGAEVYRRMEVASVDSFQGREKEFIILTCVRSNDQQGIGFLNDWRRLNVALTRARRGVMIIGNARVLSRHALWHALLTHFKHHGLVVEGAVQQLTPVKVALQKARLTANAVGPRSTIGLVTMYEGGIRPDYNAAAAGTGHAAGGSRDDSTESMASSNAVHPYFDLSYTPGEAPYRYDHGYGSSRMPASQESHSGWSSSDASQRGYGR